MAQLVEFYIERSEEAKRAGEAYMVQFTVRSLESMVRYNYPRLGKLTRRRYAEQLYSILKERANKSS